VLVLSGNVETVQPKGNSKKKRTYGMVELQFMFGAEGEFEGGCS